MVPPCGAHCVERQYDRQEGERKRPRIEAPKGRGSTLNRYRTPSRRSYPVDGKPRSGRNQISQPHTEPMSKIGVGCSLVLRLDAKQGRARFGLVLFAI